jgi:hypothetical protein
MTPRYHADIEQGTPEWDAIRAGKWTASTAATTMGTMSGFGIEALVKDVAWGRVFGPSNEPRFTSEAMKRGHAEEINARDTFAFDHDIVVHECGFVEHASVPFVGWSPDGLYGSRRLNDYTILRRGIEVKSPLHRAFMDMLETGKVPSEYHWQTKWACWVGDLEALDFIAYHPQFGARVVECTVTDSECDQMASRVHVLEQRVSKWLDILNNAREAA